MKTFKSIIIFVCFISIQIFGTQIELEYAKTPQEVAWGLMGRSELHENKGILFTYNYPQYITIWMFNCFFDIDVAFLDEKGYITEIKHLKAYPEMMDPNRPVKTLADLKNYPPDDPIVLFFQSKSVTSRFPTTYVLEVNRGWFRKNHVKVGDQMIALYPENSNHVIFEKRR